jgi:hypothetical protein
MFDRDGSGEISYEEFLSQVRGEMNQFRKNKGGGSNNSQKHE